MSFDCEACDALLIDLVERELDETRAAEVRAHAEGCEQCSRALARLEGGRRAARELVRAEPPRLDAVMAAARARAAEVRAAKAASEAPKTETEAAKPAAAPPPSEESWLDAMLRWLGSFATRPQVAMAALLVLMVGIGVYNLPQFRGTHGPDPDGDLVEPDIRAELGPSALEPAQPLPLQVDPRTQRVALGTEGEPSPEDVETTHDERPTTTIVPQPATETEVAHAEVRPHHETDAVEPTRSADEGVLAQLDIAEGTGAGRVEDGPLPDLAGATGSSTAVVIAPSTSPAPPPPVSPSISPAMPAPSSGLGRTASRPSTSATTGDDMVAPPSTSPAAMMPAAILRQARALADAGHCDQAVPRYRTLLAEHPDMPEAPQAMLELAECDRRLGHLDEADRWLARAETFSSVSAEARRARVRVRAQRDALDHASMDMEAADQAASTSQ
jgi:hypothetical protein